MARKKGQKKKYGPLASKKVEQALHERKRGELKSGGSGKRVKSREQAIAIGLAEARREGGKVPPNPDQPAPKKKSKKKSKKKKSKKSNKKE